MTGLSKICCQQSSRGAFRSRRRCVQIATYCNPKKRQQSKFETNCTATIAYLPSAIVHANGGTVDLYGFHICEDCALDRSIGGGGLAGLHALA